VWVRPDTAEDGIKKRKRAKGRRDLARIFVVRRRLPRWAWLLIFVALTAAAYGAVFAKRGTLVDFDVYRTSAVRALDAAPLYRESDGHYQYKYLPAFALVMAPIALVPDAVSEAIWFAACAVLIVVYLRQSVRVVPDRRRSERALIWLTALFLGKGFVKELVFGQTNVLLAVTLLAGLRAGLDHRHLAAGALVGAAVFVKPYAIVFVPWLLVARGITAAGAATVVVVLGLLIPATVYGWSGNLSLLADWYRTVTSTTAPNLLFGENISLATMWAKWIGPGSTATVLAAASGVALLALVAGVVAMRRRVAHPDVLEFGLLLLIVPLISPQGWDYMLLLGAPLLMCVLDRWSEMGRAWRAVTAVSIAIIAFTVFDIVGRTAYRGAMDFSVISVAAIALAVSAAALRWRRLA
jgi:hypothetical protein